MVRSVFLLRTAALLVLTFGCMSLLSPSQEQKIRAEIIRTGDMIRAAYKVGHLEKIKAFQHPDVVKSMNYTNVTIGRDAFMKQISKTMEAFSLDFTEHRIESILIQDNIAVEQMVFAIKVTPKRGGDPFVYKGRAMITFIRYKDSPTGWAVIREMIQEATP